MNGSRAAPVNAAMGLIMTFFVISAALVLLGLMQAYDAAGRRADDRARAASQVVATNALWISELAKQALIRIDDAIGPSVQLDQNNTVRDIRQAVDTLPGTVKAYVVDARGDTVYSTDPEVKPINITDREYFSAVAAGKPWYLSSLLISRLNGEQIFVFSRRLERDGRFAGAAIISFDVSLLKEVWSSLDLTEVSTVSLIRDDGVLVARYPFAAAPLNMSEYVLFTDYLPAAPVGTYLAVSPLDGVKRLVGYRKVKGTEFVAIASIDLRSAMAPFWEGARLTMTMAIPALVGLLFASFWITRLLQRDARSRSELAAAVDTNQLLLREIHHRVKNNLQLVQSLVRLQAIPERSKIDLRNRIASIAAVHEHFYRMNRYEDARADTLLETLVSSLIEVFGADATVDYDLDPVVVSHDHATPLALLANEVVTNSLKYAFADGREKRLRVELKDLGAGRARLVISDSGAGFDPQAESEGIGAKLIEGLAGQLSGTFRYDVGNGTTAVVEFAAFPAKVG